jgi:hypothetical protein
MFQRNLLRATSRAYGLQCSYKNVDGLTIWSPEKTLLKLLEDFSGQQIKNNEDLKKILDLKNKNQYLAALKPCHVLWGGVFNKINISSTDKLENSIVAEIILEDESSLSITLTLKSQRKTELGFKYIYFLLVIIG